MIHFRHSMMLGITFMGLQIGLTARAQSFPPEVRAEIHEAEESCKPNKTTLPKNFITRKDVNGDGVLTYSWSSGPAWILGLRGR
jgi:hypothetical protein